MKDELPHQDFKSQNSNMVMEFWFGSCKAKSRLLNKGKSVNKLPYSEQKYTCGLFQDSVLNQFIRCTQNDAVVVPYVVLKGLLLIYMYQYSAWFVNVCLPCENPSSNPTLKQPSNETAKAFKMQTGQFFSYSRTTFMDLKLNLLIFWGMSRQIPARLRLNPGEHLAQIYTHFRCRLNTHLSPATETRSLTRSMRLHR